jgi:hypothetical protein
MGYKISPDLTPEDYLAVAACFGFNGTPSEFVAFVIDQQRQAFMLPEEITYPMKVAEPEPVPFHEQHIDRPPMVYGGGRA